MIKSLKEKVDEDTQGERDDFPGFTELVKTGPKKGMTYDMLTKRVKMSMDVKSKMSPQIAVNNLKKAIEITVDTISKLVNQLVMYACDILCNVQKDKHTKLVQCMGISRTLFQQLIACSEIARVLNETKLPGDMSFIFLPSLPELFSSSSSNCYFISFCSILFYCSFVPCYLFPCK